MLRLLGNIVDKKDYSDNELNNMSWQEKCRLIQSDPVTCARHFDFSTQKFINGFLLSDGNPLGNVTDYFYRIEYQQRGSPNVHMIVYCKDAPIFGQDSDEDVCEYIDRFITCHKPEEESEISELVKFQTHKHTHTCKSPRKKKVSIWISETSFKNYKNFASTQSSRLFKRRDFEIQKSLE